MKRYVSQRVLLPQVMLGVLIACVRVTESNHEMCVIRKLDTLLTPHGEPLLSDLECPLLQLSNDLFGVAPSSILKPISVVHACNESCRIIAGPTEHELERETVGTSRLVHSHDFSNTLFLYNVFCTANGTL